MSNFWSRQFSVPPVAATPVIVPTAGEDEEIPYHHLPGSDAGTESSVVEESAERLFPTFNATSNHLPAANRPAAFTTPPTSLEPAEFLQWHSAYQLEYVNQHGGEAPKTLTLGAVAGQQLTAVIAASGQALYIVEQLQKKDFATMPVADQEAVAATEAFLKVLAPRLGLRPATGETAGVARDAMLYLVEQTRDAMQTAHIDAYDKHIEEYHRNPIQYPDHQQRELRGDDMKVFLDLIEAIEARIQNQMAVFSPDEIGKQLNEIKERHLRAHAFYNAPREDQRFGRYSEGRIDPNDPTQDTGVVSLDGRATIGRGFEIFMEQERRLLALENARLSVANTGAIGDKKLDVPNLVYLLQLYYNLTVEAKVTMETEYVNQLNELLKTYSAMQNLINETIKAFNPGDADEKRGLLGRWEHEFFEIEPHKLKIASMFEDQLGHGVHPIEALQGISRPKQDFFLNAEQRLNEVYKTVWDTFATQLSDTVTLLNQESQIKMNEINSLDKQKNRHFDLANGALSKLYEILQNIARTT